jgi:hypothetical protein
METTKLVLWTLFALSCISSVVSWFIYLPIFLRQLQNRDPALYAATGSQTFPSSSTAFLLCGFFLRKSCAASADPIVRYHGAILRWTFAWAFIVAFGTISVGLLAETSGLWVYNPPAP